MESGSALLDAVQAEFGLPAHAITLSGRGALGEIWRLELQDGTALAVKLLARQPPEPLVAAEVAHTRKLGVAVAACLPNRHGRYVSPAPGGWMRVSEWITGTAADPADPRTAVRLGEALGRMHASAAPVTHELDGSTLDSWYRQPPAIAELASLVDAAERDDSRWAGRLQAFLPTLQSLAAISKAPDSLILCHRDLHPENVLQLPDGRLAVLDWDNLGPADPSQEFASVLLHWFASHVGVEGPLIRQFAQAYQAAGGMGRLTGIDCFAMHIATSLNFLARQLEKAMDQRAVAEIEAAIRLLPAPEVLVHSLDWLPLA